MLGTKSKSGKPVEPVKEKAKVIPAVSNVTRIRRVDRDSHTIEDNRGLRYAVWEVAGCDSESPQVVAGWNFMLNSPEFPVQFLIRQHQPDLKPVRRQLMRQRPDWMLDGEINNVGNSLLDYLTDMEKGVEAGRRVVERRWYVSCSDAHIMEMDSLLTQTGFGADRMGSEDLGLMVEACSSGLGFGRERELYQVKEESKFLELNERYMAVYEVFKWPRRISLAFIEGMLRSGDEGGAGVFQYPASAVFVKQAFWSLCGAVNSITSSARRR